MNKENEIVVGDRVMYHPSYYKDIYEAPEFGVVTSINEKFIFVKFDKSLHEHGIACSSRDISKVIEEES